MSVMTVSSIVIKTTREHINEVINDISLTELCEIHFCDIDGKIVGTIDCGSINEQMSKLKRIQAMPLVSSAQLMYTYCADEVAEGLDRIGQKTNVFK